MTQYGKVNVKLSVKNQIKPKRNMKMFDGGPYQLLLTTRQNTKLRNAFENTMSADIRLSKSQCLK